MSESIVEEAEAFVRDDSEKKSFSNLLETNKAVKQAAQKQTMELKNNNI